MATVGIIALLAGVLGIVLSFIAPSEDKSLRNGSVFILLGGMCGGVFATPARGMPNGLPGAAAVCFILIAVGIFMVVKKPSANKKNAKSSRPLIIAAIIFALFFAIAFAFSDGGSSSNEPWRELGVSKSEYMKVYNHFKYGG